MNATAYARTVTSATDPGTNAKPYVVTVYHPGGREYLYFDLPMACESCRERIAKCSTAEELDWLLGLYLKQGKTR